MSIVFYSNKNIQ